MIFWYYSLLIDLTLWLKDEKLCILLRIVWVIETFGVVCLFVLIGRIIDMFNSSSIWRKFNTLNPE